jgi:RNA polymerase sigma-70 factor, ECF subfamily
VTARVLRAATDGTVGEAPTIEFEAAVRPWLEPLHRRLVLVVGNPHDAEDIAQEALVRALTAWDRFDGADVRAWLYTIALRLAFDHLRSRRRRLARLATRVPVASYQDVADPDLQAALLRLDPRSRAALLASVVDGYAYREIAAMLGVAEGTVASMVSRARARLRADLEDRT